MRISIYDQYPGDGRPSRIQYWLGMESWTLTEAAMLVCDIAPDLAELDAQKQLIGCFCLSGAAFGVISPMLTQRLQLSDEVDEEEYFSPQLIADVDDSGKPVVTVLEFSESITDLANHFRDVRQQFESSHRAGTLSEQMSPLNWIRYAVSKHLDIPWLEWARRKQIPRLLNDIRASKCGAMDDKLAAEAAISPAAPTPRPTGLRDEALQLAANALAKEWLAKRKDPTKRAIAKELARSDQWKELTASRIERLLKVEWKRLA